MGELKDKAKGIANEIAGNVKQAVGRSANPRRRPQPGSARARGRTSRARSKGALGDKI